MKWILTACLLVALALVVSAQAPDDEPATPQCNSVLCRMLCPLGMALDENGCPLCQCLQDPCQEEGACPEGTTCEVRLSCGEPPCDQDHVDKECIPQVPCAMPMCASRCESGYKNDARGCMTCECNEEEPHPCEGIECPMNHQCIAVPDNLPQHMVDVVLSQLDTLCLHASQMEAFMNRFGNPEDEPEPEMPPQPVRPMPGLCHQYMERFRELDDTPRAHPYEHMLRENCHPDGSFKPAMCNWAERVCWCVDDAGNQIEDTEMQMTRGQRPVCEEHKTVSTDLVIVFAHNLDREYIEESLERLGGLVMQQLSEWTGLEEAYIQIQGVNRYGANGEYIKVELELRSNDELSLPFVAAHLLWNMMHNGYVIRFGEATLTPVPEEFLAQHHSYPMDFVDDESRSSSSSSSESDSWSSSSSSSWGSSSEESYSGRCGRIWRAHRGLVVVAGVGGGIMLIVVILFIASCFRNRFSAKAQFSHKKMDKYQENLAYSNDMMSSHPDVVINEKAGRADLYKVTVPETQEKY